MVTSDAGGRATRTLFAESMNVLALKHGCSAWCLGALIAFPHVIRTPHPRRARARLPPRTGCRTAETNFRVYAYAARAARRSDVVRRARHPRRTPYPVTPTQKWAKMRFLPPKNCACPIRLRVDSTLKSFIHFVYVIRPRKHVSTRSRRHDLKVVPRRQKRC